MQGDPFSTGWFPKGKPLIFKIFVLSFKIRSRIGAITFKGFVTLIFIYLYFSFFFLGVYDLVTPRQPEPWTFSGFSVPAVFCWILEGQWKHANSGISDICWQIPIDIYWICQQMTSRSLESQRLIATVWPPRPQKIYWTWKVQVFWVQLSSENLKPCS